MLGSGLAGPGSPILLNIGTAGQISKVVAEFERFPGLDTRSFFDGAYALVGASLGGGGSYQGLRDRIRQAQGVDLAYPELDRLAEAVPHGSDGLVFCTGPTRLNPDRPRGFFGKTAKGGSTGHRARAVLEGVLMDLYAAYEILAEGDSSDFFLGAGKGLQQSQIWSQIAADLFGRTLRRTGFESAVYGAALMAAHGVGAVENLREAARAIDVTHEAAPDPKAVEFYRDEFVPFWRSVVRQL
jgi:gluconokinase